MNQRNVLRHCPSCKEILSVTTLYCGRCGITIEGNFRLCSFCALREDQREFIKVFLQARGNIKEVEKELAISYPTVRGKIDELLKHLGLERTEPRRIDILRRLRDGEIDVEEALEKM
ncbi:MAG: DUF2089 domain-containing protein [Armatimonadetes bacterium]|nr:DUF2089 domain-containing protein [Armatimonadota bacterium]